MYKRYGILYTNNSLNTFNMFYIHLSEQVLIYMKLLSSHKAKHNIPSLKISSTRIYLVDDKIDISNYSQQINKYKFSMALEAAADLAPRDTILTPNSCYFIN